MRCTAWEAGVLPLNYARAQTQPLAHKGFWRKTIDGQMKDGENKRRPVVIRGAETPRKTPRGVLGMSSPVHSEDAR